MKHTSRITAILLSLFILSHAIGLFVIQSYVDVDATRATGELVWQDLPSIAGVELERPDVAPQYSVAYITAAVIIGTLFRDTPKRVVLRLFCEAGAVGTERRYA